MGRSIALVLLLVLAGCVNRRPITAPVTSRALDGAQRVQVTLTTGASVEIWHPFVTQDSAIAGGASYTRAPGAATVRVPLDQVTRIVRLDINKPASATLMVLALPTLFFVVLWYVYRDTH